MKKTTKETNETKPGRVQGHAGRPEYKKVCAACAKPYKTIWGNGRFCSPQCHKDFYNVYISKALRHWKACPLAAEERKAE